MKLQIAKLETAYKHYADFELMEKIKDYAYWEGLTQQSSALKHCFSSTER